MGALHLHPRVDGPDPADLDPVGAALVIEGHDLNDLIGREVRDSRDELVGRIRRMYIDACGPSPTWIAIRIGRSADVEPFAPLTEATLLDRIVRLPYLRDFIVAAPPLQDDGALDAGQEQRLSAYYRMPGAA